MVHWPRPSTIKDLRGFLGLTGYYRRFVKDYGKIAAPLTLLKKDSFQWTPVAQHDFDLLKQAVTSVPVLALPDFSKTFVIEANASGSGLGAVLMQDSRPITYISQALSERGRAKSVYERELMAIVLAVQKWRHYLLGRKFIIKTNQRSLKFLMDQHTLDVEQQKWVFKLLGFDFEIHYKPGAKNRVADTLSRQPSASSRAQILGLETVDDEVSRDPRLSQIIHNLLKGTAAQEGYSLRKGSLLYKARLVLAKGSSLIPQFLQEFHSSPYGGHSGYFRTYKRISSLLYWEGQKKEIQSFVAQCAICQQNKYEAMRPAGLLQPLPIPTQVWEDISIDFIGGLPRAHHVDTILVVVDWLTKFSHFIPLSHPYTAKTVAEVFTKEVIRLHGFPTSIVSDRDSLHESLLDRTLVFIRDPPLLLKWTDEPFLVEEDNIQIRERNNILDELKANLLKANLLKAQNQMKKYADTKRRDIHFSIGDRVYLRLQPYRFKTLAKRPNEKLSPRFYGPFEILDRIGEVAYKLNLPPDAKLHPIFHISQLKKAISPPSVSQPLPHCLTEDLEIRLTPHMINDVRSLADGTIEVPMSEPLLPLFSNEEDNESAEEMTTHPESTEFRFSSLAHWRENGIQKQSLKLEGDIKFNALTLYHPPLTVACVHDSPVDGSNWGHSISEEEMGPLHEITPTS
ncbi:hypothetical protein H6P81_006086 [Aristolochia fimbriata]|uniref:Uncharacterized protein n=1 Tax=Aristolochia fimbriata TaxID=158543 RepID=A0AAV7F089_ARIFI|nr:hypothetical protein H6P81_006086 [Aristolochia fimbriata]